MPPLTVDSRTRIVNFIREFVEEHGYSPSIREIGAGVGLASTNTVQKHLELLKMSGQITYQFGMNRTVRVLDHDADKHK